MYYHGYFDTINNYGVIFTSMWYTQGVIKDIKSLIANVIIFDNKFNVLYKFSVSNLELKDSRQYTFSENLSIKDYTITPNTTYISKEHLFFNDIKKSIEKNLKSNNKPNTYSLKFNSQIDRFTYVIHRW